MFQSITWSQYFIAISVCSFVYYLLVWFFYFNAKLPALRMAANSGNLLSADETAFDGDMPSAQEVIEQLRPLFFSNYHKRELIQALQVQLKRYRSCETPRFRETINAFIVEESLTTCSIRLGEEDQRAVWI